VQARAKAGRTSRIARYGNVLTRVVQTKTPPACDALAGFCSPGTGRGNRGCEHNAQGALAFHRARPITPHVRVRCSESSLWSGHRQTARAGVTRNDAHRR
jgi:hypothetical protein